MINIIETLINLANRLDKNGLISEASQLDVVIISLAADPFMEDWPGRKRQIHEEEKKEINKWNITERNKKELQKFPTDFFNIVKGIRGFNNIRESVSDEGNPIAEAVGNFKINIHPEKLIYLHWTINEDKILAVINILQPEQRLKYPIIFSKENPKINDVKRFANIINDKERIKVLSKITLIKNE